VNSMNSTSRSQPQLIEAFEDCLSRMQHGEQLDDCLLTYPQYAATLRRMLQTGAMVLQLRASAAEVAVAQARVRAQLEGYLIGVERQQRRQRQTIRLLAAVLLVAFLGIAAFASNRSLQSFMESLLSPLRAATGTVSPTETVPASTATSTASATVTSTLTPVVTATTLTATLTITPTVTLSATPTAQATQTAIPSMTPTPTSTSTITASPSARSSTSPSRTRAATRRAATATQVNNAQPAVPTVDDHGGSDDHGGNSGNSGSGNDGSDNSGSGKGGSDNSGSGGGSDD